MTLGPISKLPLGILGMLGIKSLGRYPNAISEDIQLTFEQLDLLAAAHGEGLFSELMALTGLNFAGSTTLIVPQTEIWYVANISAFALTGVGETVTFSYGWLGDATGIGTNIPVAGRTTLAASQQATVGPGSPFSRWASQGSQFGFFVDQVTGSIDARLHLRILRFPI